jgi:hypothetical protein
VTQPGPCPIPANPAAGRHQLKAKQAFGRNYMMLALARCLLSREPSNGRALVIHQPNAPSGSRLSHIDLSEFLSGPWRLLARHSRQFQARPQRHRRQRRIGYRRQR